MSMPFRGLIREAYPSDLAAILALYESAGITTASSLSATAAREHFAALSRYPFYRVYVATIEGDTVGTYAFLLMHNLAKAGIPSAIVEDVAVLPSRHKQGIGRAMMVHAKEVARGHGAYKLALSSNQRRVGAHAFYDALGFEQHGISFVIDLSAPS